MAVVVVDRIDRERIGGKAGEERSGVERKEKDEMRQRCPEQLVAMSVCLDVEGSKEMSGR